MNDEKTAWDWFGTSLRRAESAQDDGRIHDACEELVRAVGALYEHFSPKQPQAVECWKVEQIRFREVGVGYGFVRYALEDEHPDAPWQAFFIPAGSDETYEAWFATQEAAMAAVDARADQIRARRDAEVKK